MSNDQLQLLKTEDGDLGVVAAFARQENKDPHLSEEYLRWWYFQNPSGSNTLWHFLSGRKVVGMATTNNFRVIRQSGERIVAMPQKVLTSASMRGKGLFGKLYRQTERENIKNGVDLFLTFTNEMSTPIFLAKFGYLRGLCPDVITVLPKLSAFVSSKNYESIEIDAIEHGMIESPNAFIKDLKHLKWRYLPKYEKTTVLKVADTDGELSGYIFLKKIYKKRLPLYVLLDLVASRKSETSRLLEEAVKFTTRNFALGLIALDREDLSGFWQRFSHRRIKSRFNFLVKGKDENETKEISETKFSLSFGDMDFI